MATKRTYGDRCGVARALDLVGERWALLVVRELLLGPKRFTDLRAGLPHVSPDVLAQRLRELEESGIVRRGKLPPPAGSRIYELTERGQELEPVVLGLGRFGSVAPLPPGDAQIGVDALAVALKTLFAPSATDGLPATYELRLGEDCFRVQVVGGRLDIARGPAEAPDATIEADPGTLAMVLWHGRKLSQARRSGGIAISGNEEAAKRFLGMFPLPEAEHAGEARRQASGRAAFSTTTDR
jgi:DNA-binding HxlR family transcriptional regulator